MQSALYLPLRFHIQSIAHSYQVSSKLDVNLQRRNISMQLKHVMLLARYLTEKKHKHAVETRHAAGKIPYREET